jgi:plasmid stabilization system protein ParE
MNSKPVEALPEVAQDLEDAAAHYLTWRSDGRDHVLDKYDETIAWIAWNPDLFPSKIGPVQRAIIKNTYFAVYYLQQETRTLVLAVLDGRREPKLIRKLVRHRRKSP